MRITYQAKADACAHEIQLVEADLAAVQAALAQPQAPARLDRLLRELAQAEGRVLSLRRSLHWYQSRMPRARPIEALGVGVGDVIQGSDGLG